MYISALDQRTSNLMFSARARNLEHQAMSLIDKSNRKLNENYPGDLRQATPVD